MRRYRSQQPFAPSPSARLLPALLALGSLLAAVTGCTLHPGGQTLAFLRAGRLIVANPDGTGARSLGDAAIVSFAWSPNHQQLIYRQGAAAYQAFAALPATTTRGAPDAPGNLTVASINGEVTIQITPDVRSLQWSDAWWNANGNRLLYREEFAAVGAAPGSATYYASQADQPVGIARKVLPDAASLPALAPDGSRVVVLDSLGNVRVGAPGANGAVVAGNAPLALPGTGRPARVLWQPGHDALLFATASAEGTALLLRDLATGRTRQIAAVGALLDAAFSPDGSLLLARAPGAFQVWSVASPAAGPIFAWTEDDPLALPWWSPDGREVLVQDAGGWQLVAVAARTVAALVTYAARGDAALPAGAQWQPAVGSPWSPDGKQFAFVAAGGDSWRGQPLPKPRGGATGLYVASVGARPAPPSLIDSGDDRTPRWSSADPATIFLVAS